MGGIGGRKIILGKNANSAGYRRGLDAEQVIGIWLAAQAGRDRRSGMNEQDRTLGHQTAACQVAAGSAVVVPGKDQPNSGSGNDLARHRGAPDHPEISRRERSGQGMMDGQNFQTVRRYLGKHRFDRSSLLV